MDLKENLAYLAFQEPRVNVESLVLQGEGKEVLKELQAQKENQVNLALEARRGPRGNLEAEVKLAPLVLEDLQDKREIKAQQKL